LSRGEKLATLRTLLARAGLRRQVALVAIPGPEVALGRPLREQAPGGRAGDRRREERGGINVALLASG
jgi:hypothetical protein